MTQTIDKHPSWFKLKLERRQLIRELPPESAVRVLLSCLNYLEAGRFPETLSPLRKSPSPHSCPILRRQCQPMPNG